jgi:prepilin-type N-terminal cleavage/methylation domain-containing protein
MKRIPSHPRFGKASGFTLIELLVVIAIIAILAAVLVGAGGAAINSAKRAKAANTATQIQTACLNYYTEYSVYPVPTGTTGDYTIADLTANKAAWGILIDALSGNISPSTGTAVAATTIANTRSIAFLTLKNSDVDANDAPLNPLPTGTEIYFNIAIDNDYDGILGAGSSTVTMPKFNPTFSATTGGTSTAGIAVWANCNGSPSSANPNWYVHTY